MKTILVNVSTGFFVRNFLGTRASETIREAGDVRMVMLVPEDKLPYYRSAFQYPHIVFDIMPSVRILWLERFFWFFERSSIHTHTVTMMHYTLWLKRHGSRTHLVERLVLFSLARICWHLGRFRWWRMGIRWLYARIPNHAYDALLEHYHPDLVFCSTMILPEDHILL